MLRSVSHDADLLAKAWQLPVAKLYAPLRSQSFRSICGPTSVANVLRSVGVDSGANPLRGFGLRAMSLEQIVREGGEVMPPGWTSREVHPPGVDALREELKKSNDPRYRYIANFTRVPLFGHGGGHHSPIGGFLEAEDLVFVLDVNRGYGPWLTPTERLYEAMMVRGLARFESQSVVAPGH